MTRTQTQIIDEQTGTQTGWLLDHGDGGYSRVELDGQITVTERPDGVVIQHPPGSWRLDADGAVVRGDQPDFPELSIETVTADNLSTQIDRFRLTRGGTPLLRKEINSIAEHAVEDINAGRPVDLASILERMAAEGEPVLNNDTREGRERWARERVLDRERYQRDQGLDEPDPTHDPRDEAVDDDEVHDEPDEGLSPRATREVRAMNSVNLNLEEENYQ